MWQRSSSEDRKAAVSCFQCWGPWEPLSWQEEATGSAGFMWSGEIACRLRGTEASLGSQAGQGLTQRSADLLRRWCPPPLPLTHLPGRWWAARVVGSSRDFSPLGSSSQASDFKAASLVVKSRQESVPRSLSWCPLPSSASCGCPWQSPWQPLRPPWAGSALPLVLPNQL